MTKQIDKFGVAHFAADSVFELLYQNPELDLSTLNVDDPEEFNRWVRLTFIGFESLEKFTPTTDKSVEEFDRANQLKWSMPTEYKELDIVDWLLKQCRCDTELQRAAQEIMMFQDRDLLDLLRYMKYAVDTFRKNGVVMGVGRGSSVASFVLYLIGAHRINSIEYGLSVEEFLK